MFLWPTQLVYSQLNFILHKCDTIRRHGMTQEFSFFTACTLFTLTYICCILCCMSIARHIQTVLTTKQAICNPKMCKIGEMLIPVSTQLYGKFPNGEIDYCTKLSFLFHLLWNKRTSLVHHYFETDFVTSLFQHDVL